MLEDIDETTLVQVMVLLGTKPLLEPVLTKISGGRLNKKDGLTRYADSHVKDKTS